MQGAKKAVQGHCPPMLHFYKLAMVGIAHIAHPTRILVDGGRRPPMLHWAVLENAIGFFVYYSSFRQAEHSGSLQIG